MFVYPIDFGSPEMDEALRLRDSILRKPLGMVYKEVDIQSEYDSIHLAAFDEKESIVGILILKPVSEHIVKMRQVAVKESVQQKGIGKKLVLFSESFSKMNGFRKIELHARISAVPFYEKLGYKTQGSIFQEVGIDHYFMFKEL